MEIASLAIFFFLSGFSIRVCFFFGPWDAAGVMESLVIKVGAAEMGAGGAMTGSGASVGLAYTFGISSLEKSESALLSSSTF